jgi:hypothetical protein
VTLVVFALADLIQLVGYLAWPVAALLLLAVFVKSRAGAAFLEGVAGRINHVKGLGFELDLAPESAGQVKVDFETQLTEYRVAIRKRFDALNHQHDVVRLRDRLVEDVLLPARRSEDVALRCTVYVPDIVFADALYRLTDYYPAGGDSGTVYSIRFGIIGRQWRLRESEYEPRVTTDPQELMGKWGMTRAQANDKSGDHSFLVAMLSHDDAEVGLLLVACETESPFPSKAILKKVEEHPHTAALAKRVALVNEEMRKRGPSLKLFDE